jgi:hypothetical protein
MQASRRKVAPVASATCVLVVLGLLAAGCGGTEFDGKDAAPSTGAGTTVVTAPPTTVRNVSLQAALLRAVTLTTAARTARSSISVTVTGLGGASVPSGAFDVAGAGIVDLRSGNADLALSLPRFDRLGSRGAIEQRIVAGVAYIKAPAPIVKAAGLPASVRWLSLDPRSVSRSDPSVLSQSQVDPVGQLAFLEAVSQNVHRVGVEPVRGVPTVHYEATIDVPARVSPVTTAAKRKLATITALIGSGRLDLDVWIDASGRARRVVVSVPLSTVAASLGSGAGGAPAMMRVQADLYAFGTALQVTAPPQSQVRPYSSLRLAPAKG